MENEYAAEQEMVCHMRCFLFNKELEFFLNYIRKRAEYNFWSRI